MIKTITKLQLYKIEINTTYDVYFEVGLHYDLPNRFLFLWDINYDKIL